MRMKNEGVFVYSNSLSESDYLNALKKKIIEEAQEVHDAHSKEDLITELADVMEVIYSIAQASKINLDEIEVARAKKRAINGYFLPENFIN